jgi:hypothetical protein
MRQIDDCSWGINRAGGAHDRVTADLAQIQLIFVIELGRALARALEQVEVVLRETYPEVSEIWPKAE